MKSQKEAALSSGETAEDTSVFLAKRWQGEPPVAAVRCCVLVLFLTGLMELGDSTLVGSF